MSERFPHDAAYKAFFSDPAKIDVRLLISPTAYQNITLLHGTLQRIYGIYFLAAQRLVTAFVPPAPLRAFPLELRPAFQTEPLRGLSPSERRPRRGSASKASQRRKKRFEESGLASVTERPTGVKARKLRVFAQPFPSPPLLPRVGSASVTERVFERWRGRCAHWRTLPLFEVPVEFT